MHLSRSLQNATLDITVGQFVGRSIAVASGGNSKFEKKGIVEHIFFVRLKHYFISFHFRIMSRICEIENCNVKAFFNYEGVLPGIRCGTHRLEGQINIYNKTCAIETCTKRPIFNVKGEKKALYCKSHKTEDMVDVKNPKCLECNKRATHGIIGTKGMYCAQHSKEDMVFVYKKICKETGCTNEAKYYFVNGPKTALYCSKHKKSEMIRS